MTARQANPKQSNFCLGHRLTILFTAVLLTWESAAATLTRTPDHWAFQPLRRSTLPPSPHPNPIDAFVASALAKQGQALSSEADRRTLIRRLSFDLRGLPPTPNEIAAFLGDARPDAFERLVDLYLGSPQYGERWGRHWLDIAGYADSNGYFNADSDRPLAWKYRDYVVRSINADKPFDRFIQEQIAGDELVGYAAGGDVTPEMIDPLVATHFWRNAPDGTGESDGNPLEVKVDKYAVLEGSVQILGSAFLGLTLQCARCHDHKFEPVTQSEYYQLQAILRPAFDPDRWLKPNERIVEIGLRDRREAHHRRTAEITRDLKTLAESLEGLAAPFRRQALDENLATLDPDLRKTIRQALDKKEGDRDDTMKSLLKTHASLVEIDDPTLQTRFPAFAAAAQSIRKTIRERESKMPPPLERIAATFESSNPPPAHHLLVRGNHAKEGIEIAPGTPAILTRSRRSPGQNEPGSDSGPPLHDPSGPGAHSPASSGRRLALARWLTSPDNPMVARALVNRIWHHHFGEGLAGTPDNLGLSGARPPLPELLDWLASEFMQTGWSLKHLHRLVLTSAVWKQAATPNPYDSPFTRSQPRRLDAESIRDAMLAVSGELNLAAGGPYVPTRTNAEGQVVIEEKLSGARRRSLYLQQRRTHPVEFLSTFDGPAHNPVCVQRVSSTVALQSLALLNSEFVRLRARAFARRVAPSLHTGSEAVADSQPNAAAVNAALVRAFELAFSRLPAPDELSAATNFIRDQQSVYQDQKDAPLHVWTDLCQMLLASNAFLYVD